MTTTRVETVNVCLICADSRLEQDTRFARLLGLVPPYAVQRCTACGLRWLSPRPTAAGYAELYSFDNYFEGEQAVASYAGLADQRRPYFRARLARIERQAGLNRPLRILEIGAATGEFLAEARARGHVAEGVELSAGARQTAQRKYGIELLAEMPASGRYDAIHMNHVLEHMPDPRATLEQCAGLLAPGGLLVLEVPQQFDNDLDRLKRLLGRFRPRFNSYSLHHTYFFTPATLDRLLQRCGFRVERMATANAARTPLWPFRPGNGFLRVYLWLADASHRGGNIIEAYARKPGV